VFIAGLNDEIEDFVKRGVVYRYLIDSARAKDFQLFMATAAIVEVYRIRGAGPTASARLDDFMVLIDEDLIVPIELDRITAIEAHSLCRKYGSLRPFDAIHLACAVSAGCDYLLTWDKKLAGIQHDRIAIDRPRIHATGLFVESDAATAEEQLAWNALISGKQSGS
jgi:predicted nucleic acid-binding protein